MTKYFKRGTREYYQVTPERVIRLTKYESHTIITIWDELQGQRQEFVHANVLEGVEISRKEFAKEFEVASRLIVMEP